jgi:hypothetical protein
MPSSHFFKKKKSKNKKYIYMLGWLTHPIGGGQPPCLAWVVWPHPGRPSGGGRTTPSGPQGGSVAPWAKWKFERLAQGAAEPPPRPLGVVQPPLGPIAQNFVFGRLAQGAAKPLLGPLGVVRPPPDQLAWGWPNHPRANGVAGHHLWGGSATLTYFFDFFFFFFGFFFF